MALLLIEKKLKSILLSLRNDETSAGIRCTDMDAFSVQYHPESNPGPHDSEYLFDQFISMMSK